MLDYRDIYILVIVMFVLWALIALLLFIFVKKPKYKRATPKAPLYLNTTGNGTHMVIGGFSHPNYLMSMNRVPYNGPL
jgi:hypothetical protein